MNIKVITSNVWADVFGNPVSPRDTGLVSLFTDYRPDIICLQEMHPHWHESRLKPELAKLNYAEIQADLHGFALNYTPLLYRADKYTPERTGFFMYSGLNDYDSKSVTWAVLKSAETGETFLAMATHLYWGGLDEPGNGARITDCTELSALISEICGKEKLPVFCGGDYNCDIYSEPYKILTANGLVSAGTVAKVRKNNICSIREFPVYHPETQTFTGKLSDKTYDFSYDHVIIKNVKSVETYEVITDKRALEASDHCPVCVELSI